MKKGTKKENSREIRFGIRMNKEEHQEWTKKAKEKGFKSISDYLRYLVKNDK